jgi:diacylglycerol kinase (ATP)
MTRRVSDKIRDSLSGLREGWARDRAIRIQLTFSAAAAIALLIARPPLSWALASVTLLVLGLAAELVNVALETLLDRLHPHADAEIGVAKDMASAAAFLINGAAAVVLIGALAWARAAG